MTSPSFSHLLLQLNKRLFTVLDQVEFTFDEITISTNNEVSLLYPSHSNSEYFEIVSDFISKCCLKEALTRAPNRYVEYLAEFCSAKDKSPSHPSASTPVVAEMYKEAHQAASGLTSLGATSEEGAHSQLSSGMSTFIIIKPVYSASFIFTLSLHQDVMLQWPIIVLDESGEEETERYKDTHATSHDSQKDKLEQQKAKDEAEVAFHKAQPSYSDINQLIELLPLFCKRHQQKLIDEEFHTGHASASPAEGEKNTNQATKDVDNANLNQQPTTTTPPTTLSFQSHLFPNRKGKEVMSSKDTEDEETESDSEDDHANPAEIMTKSSEKKKLKKFSFVTEGGEQIYLTTEKIKEQKRIEESLNAELAKQEVEKLKSELVDLMGIDVVTQYYNKRLMYIKYYDKVLKRRKNSKITNCYVLTTKGPITLKVYREDGTNEVISNLKVIDLHLAEWRKVVQACPNRKENRMEDHLWADKDKNGIP
ncbi:hypothetical protein Tco_0597072 [Tanacetum coccineum]